MARQIKKGAVGRVPYTFNGKTLILYPNQSSAGYPWPPTMAELAEPIIIPVNLLRELLASKGVEDRCKGKGRGERRARIV